jgi:hypothetical protein
MVRYEEWSDRDLLDEFAELDEDEGVRLTDWEVEFFDSLTKRQIAWTEGQREKAIEIIRSYQ